MINAQRLAFATLALTLILVGVGVLVRATGSGLGCPDWPLCHGGVVPPSESHEPVIEFSHRFVAAIVGFMVIALAVMAWREYRHVPFIWGVAFFTVPLVGFQGVLGAITVYRELPPEIVATHLVTAMAVLVCLVAVAVAMWMEDPAHRLTTERLARVDTGRLRVVGLVSLAWLIAVMWVGGYMSESGASTACEGWPLCSGSITPANDDQEITHMLHRYLAGGFGFLIVAWAWQVWGLRSQLGWAMPTAVAAGVLYLAQVVVGALNVWYTFPEPLTISHTVIASFIWTVLAGGIILAYYAPTALRRRQAVTSAGVPA